MTPADVPVPIPAARAPARAAALLLVTFAAAALAPTAVQAQTVAAAAGAADGPELRAQLTPRRFTTLAAEIGARIQHLPVQEGSVIRAGQLLVSFDCSLQQAQAQKVAAALEAAEKQLAVQRRLADLNATGRQEVDMAEAEVAKNRAETGQVAAQLSRCRVVAPFAGRVAEQKVREQQFVQPGQPLLEILDDAVLEVEFIMPSRWLATVRAGTPVRIAVDETGRQYPARIQRLGARVDPVSQSIRAVATIVGRPAELMAGMSGRVLVQRDP